MKALWTKSGRLTPFRTKMGRSGQSGKIILMNLKFFWRIDFHEQCRLSELSDIDSFLVRSLSVREERREGSELTMLCLQTYEVVSSEDPLPVTSAIHTIRLRRITSNNTTFVEWTTVCQNVV